MLMLVSMQKMATDTFTSDRTDFRDESIYFLITTRFYDGDPKNNVLCWDNQAAQIETCLLYTSGAPVIAGDLLLNCGIVIQHGQILGIVPNTYLPNYSEFYEKRWFASAQDLRACEVRYAGDVYKRQI